MATKSPRPYHTQWPNVGAPTDLPNVVGSPTQDEALEAGDICYVSSTSLYVCTYAALGAAVWETSSFVKSRAVIADQLSVAGWNPLGMYALNDYMKARNRGTWETLYKHLWWTFTCPQNGHQDTVARRFNSEAALWDYLTTIIPMMGPVYDGMVLFTAYDLEHLDDPFPLERHFRSSLLATMMGHGNWLRRRQVDRHGLSHSFTGGGYYLSLAGDLGRQLVIWYTTHRTPTPQDPIVEDDRVIWYSAGKRGGMYNWPHTTYGPFSYLKPVAWNMATEAWDSPAPNGFYTVGMPFVLYELNKGRFLYINDWTSIGGAGSGLNRDLRHSVSVMIFPLVLGNHLAFAAYPFGVDTFFTEYLDPSVYELTLRVKHRKEFADKYHVIPAQQNDGIYRSMFSLFHSSGNNICYPVGYTYHIDNNDMPTDVYVARRNIKTGIRSPWKRLVHLNRRIPHADFRLDPVFRED